MLISRRKEGEALLIGDEIEIRIVAVRKKKAILGVIAPRDVKISVRKLAEVEMANTMAAVSSTNLDHLLPIASPDDQNVLFVLGRSRSEEGEELADEEDEDLE